MISEKEQFKHMGGRPKKPVKRETVTGVRFTKAEYYVVKQKAAKAGLKVSIYIRQMALQGKIIARMSEEERHFVRQLSGMANNLNQLTKKAHQEGLLTAVLMFEKHKNLVEGLLEKYET
jgi:Bacterial mobilisation protein (MobC)